MISSEQWEHESITEPNKEEWYGTKFVKGYKKDLQTYKDLFEDEDWNDICSRMKKPPKNRFMPAIP